MKKVDDFEFHFFIIDFVLYRKAKPEWMFSSKQAWLAWNGKFANKPAGSIFRPTKARTRYIRVKLNGRSMYAHRILWEMLKGPIPKGMFIDHINGDGLDNRIDNLMLVNSADSAKNMPMQKKRTGKHHGVTESRSSGKWEARIGVNGRKIYLGTFESLEEAVSARKLAEHKYGFSSNHGRQCNE